MGGFHLGPNLLHRSCTTSVALRVQQATCRIPSIRNSHNDNDIYCTWDVTRFAGGVPTRQMQLSSFIENLVTHLSLSRSPASSAGKVALASAFNSHPLQLLRGTSCCQCWFPGNSWPHMTFRSTSSLLDPDQTPTIYSEACSDFDTKLLRLHVQASARPVKAKRKSKRTFVSSSS
jgi:hypothetical protein